MESASLIVWAGGHSHYLAVSPHIPLRSRAPRGSTASCLGSGSCFMMLSVQKLFLEVPEPPPRPFPQHAHTHARTHTGKMPTKIKDAPRPVLGCPSHGWILQSHRHPSPTGHSCVFKVFPNSQSSVNGDGVSQQECSSAPCVFPSVHVC